MAHARTVNFEIDDSKLGSSELINSIINNYKTDGVLSTSKIPVKQAKAYVEEIIYLLLDLTFPKYRDETELRSLPTNIVRKVDSVNSLMKELVASVAMPSNTDCSGQDVKSRLDSDTLSTLLATHIVSIRKLLNEDIKSILDRDPAAKSYDEVIYSYPSVIAVTVYRYAHILQCHRIPIIPRMMTEWSHSATGIDIHPGATVGRRFFIDHGTGVVVGETTIIGDDVTLYQGVTLGALSFPKDSWGEFSNTQRHPTIGNNVTIYANATILGGDTEVAANTIVGASVFLCESVPLNSVIKQKPSKFITRIRNISL